MRTAPVISLILALTLPIAARPAGAEEDEGLRLHAYPNPFVAGYNAARVYYFLPAAGRVTLTLYGRDGNEVRTLADGEAKVEGVHNGEEQWNGRDEDRELVLPGAYVLVLEARVAGEVKRAICTVVVKR